MGVNILVAHGGGPTAVINTSLQGVVEGARASGKVDKIYASPLQRAYNTGAELADILGVTSQSVSRWEKGACYPDMELLPAIANYFNVTVDDLLGMNEIRSRERLNAIFTEALNLERESKYEDAVGVFRAALKNFPDNIELTSELALALSKCESVNNKKEAIALSEKVLARCTNEKIRSTVRANLCYLYRDCGFNDKAEETARTLPHIWECREIHLREFVADNKDLSDRHLNIIACIGISLQ